MKITNKQLKQIIKEELNKVIKESWSKPPEKWFPASMYGKDPKDLVPKESEEQRMNSLWQVVQFLVKRDGVGGLTVFSQGDPSSLQDYVEKAKEMVPDLWDIKYWDFLKFISWEKKYIEYDDESGTILNWP